MARRDDHGEGRLAGTLHRPVRMLGDPTPHEADPIGAQYAFETRVVKAGGGDGFADGLRRTDRLRRTS